jgi:hypothetical protein
MPTAMEQVLDAMKAAIETGGIVVHIDRDEDEFLQEGEIDCINLHWDGSEIQTPDNCGYLWDGLVVADCWGKMKTGQTPFQAASALVASLGAIIHADETFGGKVEASAPTAVSGMKHMRNDVGAISVTIAVQYRTPRGDWNTLSN